MTGADEFTVGQISGRLGSLEARTASIESKLDRVLAETARAKGGFGVVAWLAGGLLAFGAAVVDVFARSH